MGELKINHMTEYPNKIYYFAFWSITMWKDNPHGKNSHIPFCNFKFSLIKGLQEKTAIIRYFYRQKNWSDSNKLGLSLVNMTWF